MKGFLVFYSSDSRQGETSIVKIADIVGIVSRGDDATLFKTTEIITRYGSLFSSETSSDLVDRMINEQ